MWLLHNLRAFSGVAATLNMHSYLGLCTVASLSCAQRLLATESLSGVSCTHMPLCLIYRLLRQLPTFCMSAAVHTRSCWTSWPQQYQQLQHPVMLPGAAQSSTAKAAACRRGTAACTLCRRTVVATAAAASTTCSKQWRQWQA